MSESGTLELLFATLPQIGQVEWLGLRPARRQAMLTPTQVNVDSEQGLIGDRYAGRSGKRQVSLIQWEHLAVIASTLGLQQVSPAQLRRNIAVSGLNLLALKDKRFQIGGAVLEYTGLCHPCSYMEKVFGPGGYNAVRGHGGITAKVLEGGKVCLQDKINIL